MNLNFLNLVIRSNYESYCKNTGKKIEVEKVPVFVDELTSYFVYEDIVTHKKYKYNELKFN